MNEDQSVMKRLTVVHPHLPGFTLFTYQLKKDLESCFPAIITVDTGEEAVFEMALDQIQICRIPVRTTDDVNRQDIYQNLVKVIQPTGELPPVQVEEEIEEEYMQCLCSGE